MRALNDSNLAIDDFGAGGGRSSCYDVVRSERADAGLLVDFPVGRW